MDVYNIICQIISCETFSTLPVDVGIENSVVFLEGREEWDKIGGGLYIYVFVSISTYIYIYINTQKDTFVRLIRISLYASTDSPTLVAPESTQPGGLLHVY